MENLIKDLDLSFQFHTELLEARKWQCIDDLWELDWKIIRVENYILDTLARHPEFAESYDTSDFLLDC